MPDCVVTVDHERLIGNEVQTGRDPTSKPFDDRASAFVSAKYVGEASDPLPDGVSREVVSDGTVRKIASVDVRGHQPANVIFGLKGVNALS